MASSGSDSDSPHGSPSSPASTITVASAAEVRRKLEDAVFSQQLKFLLAPDSSLADAHELWGMVTADEGGESEFLNPDLLSNKEEAYRFVKSKLERIRRWKRKVDRKQLKVTNQMAKLKELIDAGGPGVPTGFEPRCYNVLPARFDITQVVDEKEMNMHIEALRAFLLQGSPATPTTAGAEDCLEREEKEQLDVVHFNLEYLDIKDTGLRLLSAYLQNRITALEERFLRQRTHLGAGTTDFVRFVEVPIYSQEVPPEGSGHFYG